MSRIAKFRDLIAIHLALDIIWASKETFDLENSSGNISGLLFWINESFGDSICTFIEGIIMPKCNSDEISQTDCY
jgi:hypothetical protein